MKTVILLTLLALSGSLSGQYYTENNPKPKDINLEKGDNLITITTDQADSINFSKFGKYLVSKGYTMQTKDWDYMLLVTDPKGSKIGMKYDYALSITFVDTLIVIRVKQSGISLGASMMHQAQIIWTEWEFATGSGNVHNQSFRDFYPVLKDYGYPITWARE